MAEPKDVLPLSEHLYVVEQGWPRSGKTGTSLLRLHRAGRAIDEARRLAAALRVGVSEPPQTQPVGVLYRETAVLALRASISELRIATRQQADPAMDRVLDDLHGILERAAAETTSLVRPYQYAEEVLPDISALWAVGEAVEPTPSGTAVASHQSPGGRAAEQSVREYERRVREADTVEVGSSEEGELERLLVRDAEQTPRPLAADVLPSRADVLWRQCRLEAVDVARLRRWVSSAGLDAMKHADLTRVVAFIESASQERANILLDAFCTDSPEAV